MSEVVTVKLQGLENSGPLRFLSAQWWDQSSRFALVTMAGADGGETTLRMDINKQAFIDRVEDEASNEVIERLALPIWRQIVAARQTPRRRESA